MWFVYLDESGDSSWRTYAAYALPEEGWNAALDKLKKFRQDLRVRDGIRTKEELHACDFVKGRGSAAFRLPPQRRQEIYRGMLQLATELPSIRLFTASDWKSKDEQLFEWLMNRVHVALTKGDSRAMLFYDSGRDEYKRWLSKLRVQNQIPSQFHSWDSARWQPTKNIPLERFLERPVSILSEDSYFIQLADFTAYALLQQDRPLYARTPVAADNTFSILKSICQLEANKRDPFGTVRITQVSHGQSYQEGHGSEDISRGA